MNTKAPQAKHNGYGLNPHKTESKWREATSCEPDCSPSYPDPKPCPDPNPCTTIREKDSKETYFLLNTSHSERKDSETNSKLAWVLLSLATLLFLGSLLSNLLMVWTFSRTINNTNNSREVITTTTTKEVIRVVEESGYEGDEYYYYAPAARW